MNKVNEQVEERIERIKSHFEEEALEYDGLIRKLIPNYQLMIEALITAIPFSAEQSVEVADLGCGTGTVALAVKKAYPRAVLTCVDLSGRMLDMARIKLDDPGARFVQDDFYHLHFDRTYDVIVSSLALHHLETDHDKLAFYQKIFNALNSGGIFINADVVLASDPILQEKFLEHWWSFMRNNVPAEEVENKWKLTYRNEDRPASMTRHLEMLKEVGFSETEIVWKWYNFSVYTARKL